MALTSDYKDELFQRLRDPNYAAGYLSDCAVEGQEAFLVGLRNVAEALVGKAQLASESDLDSARLRHFLNEDGNPRLSSLFSLLDAVGLQVQCVPSAKMASRS